MTEHYFRQSDRWLNQNNPLKDAPQIMDTALCTNLSNVNTIIFFISTLAPINYHCPLPGYIFINRLTRSCNIFVLATKKRMAISGTIFTLLE